MKIQVRFFAICRDITGVDHTTVALPEGATGETLWMHLLERFPALAPYRTQCRLAVNETYVANTATLHAGDEVAIIPPVSGG